MLPRRGLGWSGSIYDVDPDEAATSTMSTMRATVTGYAWSSRGRIQEVALGVLSVYVTFALTHVSSLVWTTR